MINLAIGDPRSKGGVVIRAEDMWAGTGGKAVIASNWGRVYNQNEIESLLLFLGEVIIRRLRERGKERPDIRDQIF